MTPDGAKQTLVVATLLWAVAGLGQGALAPVTNPNLTSSPAAVYSPDPSHLWNRLFATFYHQQVSSYVDHKRVPRQTRWA